MQIASLTGVQIVECERDKEAGQICRKRGRGREVPSLSLTPYPTPSLFFVLTSLAPFPKSEHLEQVMLQITLGL